MWENCKDYYHLKKSMYCISYLKYTMRQSKNSDYICGSSGTPLSVTLVTERNNSHKHSQSPLTNHAVICSCPNSRCIKTNHPQIGVPPAKTFSHLLKMNSQQFFQRPLTEGAVQCVHLLNKRSHMYLYRAPELIYSEETPKSM